VGKELDTTILHINVFLTLDHFQPLSTNSLTAKTPCMIHQCKDPAPFTWNLKNPQKCVEDLICLFTDVNAVQLETIRTHQPQDVQPGVSS
jgi:hypothetical protein